MASVALLQPSFFKTTPLTDYTSVHKTNALSLLYHYIENQSYSLQMLLQASCHCLSLREMYLKAHLPKDLWIARRLMAKVHTAKRTKYLNYNVWWLNMDSTLMWMKKKINVNISQNLKWILASQQYLEVSWLNSYIVVLYSWASI